MAETISMTAGEQEAFRRFCDQINGRLETEEGKEIVALAASSLRNGLIDKFHLITEENVKQMLVLHIATLPVFGALFGERANFNPITLVLHKAAELVLGIKPETPDG